MPQRIERVLKFTHLTRHNFPDMGGTGQQEGQRQPTSPGSPDEGLHGMRIDAQRESTS